MQDYTSEDSRRLILHFLEPGEQIHVETRARDAVLALTDRRLIVAENDRLALNLPFSRLRRVQFDVERARPATLVIVPEPLADEPAVLAIPPEAFPQVASALVIIGERLATQA
jgi:hypothetical protein